MSVNLKWIETVVLVIVVIKIDAQPPLESKKEDMTVWYPNQILDVWSGKKSLINVITNDFFGVLNGVALNPQSEWRPQKKIDLENIPKNKIPLVEIDGEEEYDDDYEDVETYENYDDESKQKSLSDKYGQY